MVFGDGDSSQCVTPPKTSYMEKNPDSQGPCTRLVMQRMSGLAGESSPPPLVCKTHFLSDALEASSRPNAMLFVTSSSNTTEGDKWHPSSSVRRQRPGDPRSNADSLMKSWRRQFHNQYASVNLAYVAHAEALKSHDDLLLQDYAQLFDLTAKQVAAIRAYIEASCVFILCCCYHARVYSARAQWSASVPLNTIPRF